jgi:hypothetical protein
MPANPLRGDVELSALGRRYIFRLGINELISLQSALGFDDEDEFLQKVGSLRSTKALRTVGSCCLIRAANYTEDPDADVQFGIDEREAGNVITDIGVGAFIRAVAKAMSLAWADPSEGADGSEGKADRLGASPGKRSLRTAPRPA